MYPDPIPTLTPALKPPLHKIHRQQALLQTSLQLLYQPLRKRPMILILSRIILQILLIRELHYEPILESLTNSHIGNVPTTLTRQWVGLLRFRVHASLAEGEEVGAERFYF